jgi:uncharacterized protein YegP (UPF0339 family)
VPQNRKAHNKFNQKATRLDTLVIRFRNSEIPESESNGQYAAVIRFRNSEIPESESNGQYAAVIRFRNSEIPESESNGQYAALAALAGISQHS